MRQRRRTTTPWLAASLTGLAAAVSMACGTGQPRQAPGAVDTACLADVAGSLHLVATVPACASDGWLCKLKCRLGDGGSCLALAYSAERVPEQSNRASQLYRRACLLGAANACTNYAATIWAGQSSDEQLICAQRTFEKACTVKEPFACGMVGRMMLESSSPPHYADGRRYLEKTCDEVGGFSCRVLAKHLESGKLGDYRPESIRTLLARACATGDPDGCGVHATAAETFQ